MVNVCLTSLKEFSRSLVDAIKAIYTYSSAMVIYSDGDTEPFQILTGVLQGGTLAPFLFIIVLDYIMWHALKDIHQTTGIILEKREETTLPWSNALYDLEFIDDVALLAETLLLHIEDASKTT